MQPEVGAANLVGHSMGALVAMDAAARHGTRVRKLALLGAAPAIPVNDLLLSRSAEDDHHALELLTGWGYGRRAHYGVHKMPGIWMTGGGLRTLERAAPGVLHNDLVATNAYEDGEAVGRGRGLSDARGDRCPRFDDAGEARPRARRDAAPLDHCGESRKPATSCSTRSPTRPSTRSKIFSSIDRRRRASGGRGKAYATKR